MALFATGNAAWDQGLNAAAGGLAGLWDPSKQAQAGYYGAETGKVITDTQRQRFLNDNLYALPKTADQILGGAQPPAPSPLVSTVAGAQTAPPAPPPAAPAPGAQSLGAIVAGAVPSMGTDGKPLPPDPSLAQGPLHPGSIQQPGGGVKFAPPAQGNGQPAAPLDLTMYSTQLSQSGLPHDVQMTMLGSMLNTAVTRGLIDNHTANTMLARYGQTAPYVSDNSRASAMETTVQQGRNTIGNTQETGRQNRLTYDNELDKTTDEKGNPVFTRRGVAAGQPAYDPNVALKKMEVVPTKGPGDTKVLTPLPDILAGKQAYQGYEPERALAGDKLLETAPLGNPSGPPVLTRDRDAAGKTPYQPAQALAGQKTVNVVDNGTGRGHTITEAELAKAPPGKFRRMTPEDEKIITIYDRDGKPINQTAASSVATGGTPVPTNTDQFLAQSQGSIFRQYLDGNMQGAEASGAALGRAQTMGIPKQVITPDQQARMKSISDEHLKALYPVPSGINPNSTDYAPTADPDTLAYHDAVVRQLQNGEYRNNPAGAVTRAWDMMRADGVIPQTTEQARGGTFRLGLGNTPQITGDGKLLIRLRKDAQGNILNGQGQPMPWPGGGPRPSPLANTVAGAGAGGGAAAATPPAGGGGGRAIGPAPPGPGGRPVPDGTPITGPNGERGVVRGGQVYAP